MHFMEAEGFPRSLDSITEQCDPALRIARKLKLSLEKSVVRRDQELDQLRGQAAAAKRAYIPFVLSLI